MVGQVADALLGQQARKPDDPGSLQRLAAGKADLRQTEARVHHADEPHDFLVAKDVLGGEPWRSLGRCAIKASRPALVGHGNPQCKGGMATLFVAMRTGMTWRMAANDAAMPPFGLFYRVVFHT